MAVSSRMPHHAIRKRGRKAASVCRVDKTIARFRAARRGKRVQWVHVWDLWAEFPQLRPQNLATDNQVRDSEWTNMTG
jgi:hypothetical protein